MNYILPILFIFASCEKEINPQSDCRTCFTKVVYSEFYGDILKSQITYSENEIIICDGDYKVVKGRRTTETGHAGEVIFKKVKTFHCR